MVSKTKLKQLVNEFTLSNKVAIYIPSTQDVNKDIDNSKEVDKIAEIFSGLFGGATSQPVTGYWNSDSGLVKENPVIVYSYCDDTQLKDNLNRVILEAKRIKQVFSQEAVSVEINSQLYLI